MSKTSKTWWGQRFLDVLERQSDPGRLARGRHYLSTQQIRQWEVRGARVEARIREAPDQWFWMHNRWPKEAWVKAGVYED